MPARRRRPYPTYIMSDACLVVGALDWIPTLTPSLLFSPPGRGPAESLPQQACLLLHLIVGDLKTNRRGPRARSLEAYFKQVSRDSFRTEFFGAWLRTLEHGSPRHEHLGDYESELMSEGARADFFVPSATLVDMVREGIRSHSRNYSKLLEPTFSLDQSISLVGDENIGDFIAVKLWRLILATADQAVSEGADQLQLGNENGFLDELDHLILDRIPVAPKHVTPFLQQLYREYGEFISKGHKLPGRGLLWADQHGLFCKLEKLPESLPGQAREYDIKAVFE